MKRPADHNARTRATQNLDAHQFLDAGAGAGKTSVLVDHYLWILDHVEGIGPHQVAAVTFTNKAAAEMKERLRAECRDRALEAQADRWQRVARELEIAPIDTIHGLCSRILHENAVAARVDPQFTVIEGIEQTFLLEETVRRSILRRLDAEVETAAELVAKLQLAGACEAIQTIVAARARLGGAAFLDAPAPSPQDIETHWNQIAPQAQELLLRLLPHRPSWRRAKATLASNRADSEHDVLEQLRIKRLRLIGQAEDDNLPASSRLDALRQLCKGSVQAAKATKWPSDAVKDEVAEALRTFSTSSGSNRKLMDDVLEALETDGCAEAASLTSALAHETRTALDAYQQAKRSRSALDFEDLQLQVRELWRNRPDVLEQYQRRLRYVLVDEFQDTDDLQKQILWPLADGGAKLFVVGDAKQSIYRFRNADVTVFNRAREEMAADPDSAVERLAVNFRSTPAMTDLFNDLFSRHEVMGSENAEDFEASYEPLQSYREWNDTEALELYIVTGAAADEDEEDTDRDSLTDVREQEAELLARRIRELVDNKTLIGGKCDEPREARFGDFAMLLRAMTDVQIYERALRLQGVPYYVVAGRGFYNRPEVRDVVNCLRAIENSRDEVALVGALRSPLFSLSDETLFWLSRLEGTWWQRLQAAQQPDATGPLANITEDELDKLSFAAETFHDLRERKNRLTLSRLVNEVIERTGLSAVLATRFGGDQMVSNLRKLADIAGEFEQSGAYSLRGLIRRLQELVVREEREGQAPVQEEESDVVKLLTIHAAKGLEWPIVLVPDLARRPRRDSNKALISHPQWGVVALAGRDDGASLPAVGLAINALNDAEELAEARRLFYVACTRARDRLILSSPFTNWKGGAGDTALRWLCEAFEINPDCPTEIALTGDGWTGFARVLEEAGGGEAGEVSRAKSRLEAAPTSERLDKLLQGASMPDADPAVVEQLLRRRSPLAMNLQAKQRFHATELATYLDCPRRYRLRYLQGAPEQMLTAPMLDAAEPLSAIELGDVVHRLLRVVGSGGKQRLDEALALGLGLDAQVALRAQHSLDLIRQMLSWYLDSELYAEFVAPARRLRTEMTVLFEARDGQEPPAIFEGKIDALAEGADDDLHLLDFKTGRRNEHSAREHEFQVGLYCAGVARVAVGNLASARVVYLSQEAPQIISLDPVSAARKALEEALSAVAGIREGRFEADTRDRCADCILQWACRE